MKNYNSFKFSRKFRYFFKDFLKILSNFWPKCGQKFRKFRNMHLVEVRGGGGAPRRLRIYENLTRKINGNLQFLDSSNGNFAIFS